MNRGEMRTLLNQLLADPLGESKLWSDTLKNQLIQDALEATLYWLPPEVLEVLWKTPANVNIVNGTAEYGIEGAGFSLTDYLRWVRIRVWDGVDTMREAKVVSQDKLTSTNYLYQGNKYNPRVAIIPRTADATGRQRAILISPTPAADKALGLELVYVRRHATMTLDADYSILPVEYQPIAMQYAAAFGWSKAEKPDLVAVNREAWRDRMIMENVRFGRRIEPPKEPVQ